jgi:hypothetical protein
MTRHVAHAADFAGFARAIFRRRIVTPRHLENSRRNDIGVSLDYRNEPDMDQVRATLAARFPW